MDADVFYFQSTFNFPSWTGVLPQVAAFTHGCAYDRAGLGWSEAARESRTLPRMIDELHAVLVSAGAGPYVLVGHSFGAFLVCAYASQRPTDIAGLVLLDPPSEWHGITREQARLLSAGVRRALGSFDPYTELKMTIDEKILSESLSCGVTAHRVFSCRDA